jgi:hypothetical protein
MAKKSKYIIEHEKGNIAFSIFKLPLQSKFLGLVFYPDERNIKKHFTIVGDSEKEVYDNCVVWLELHFPGDYSITEG